jgi:hypothetical protein
MVDPSRMAATGAYPNEGLTYITSTLYGATVIKGRCCQWSR